MSVWLAGWSIDLLRRRDRSRPEATSAPVLLVMTQDQRRVVARCCDVCRDAGVRPGMSLAQARAVVPEYLNARVLAHEPEHERESLRRLAVWAQRFSPLVASDEPDGLLMDISGCAPLFGGEARLLHEVERRLLGLGLRSRIAIASTFGCAHAAARFAAGGTIIPAGGERDALSGLPVRALRVDRATVDALGQVGIERIGDLLGMPRASLPARFGTTLLLRLDQALGEAMETITPVHRVPPLVVERVFSGPTKQIEALDVATRDLLSRLSELLLRRECGVLKASFTYLRSDIPAVTYDLALSRPTRDAQRLWRLARPKIERLNMGFGVEGVRVAARTVAPLRHEQMQAHEDDQCETAGLVDRATAELIDSLTNRLGDDRVLRVAFVESHAPGRAFAMRPAAHGTAQQPERFILHDRPTVLFERPEAIEVIAVTPDGPVHRVFWNGVEHDVRACCGAERIGPEWWRGERGDREFFAVQTTHGQWMWIARETTGGAWRMHGVWA